MIVASDDRSPNGLVQLLTSIDLLIGSNNAVVLY